MQNIKVLEMLKEGKIDYLKKALENEIYEESLKSKPGVKKRYSAMKKYFMYYQSPREVLQKPCEVEFEGKNYISFCNAYSLALTTESCGQIGLYEDKERYPDVSRLINFDGDERKVGFTKVLAEAKSKGYKLNKTEFNRYKFKYLMKYDGTYFKLALFDSTFSIIDDGEEATAYHKSDKLSPIVIKTSIGVCIVMPVNYDDTEENDVVVIEV